MRSPSSQKEYPWHLPAASLKHQQWFENLIDFHGLTLSWREDIKAGSLKTKADPHLLSRGHVQSASATDTGFLDSLSSRSLESFLDDSSPEEVLKKLDQMVWTVQAVTVAQLLAGSDREALLPVLGQGAWKFGRKLAEKRWSGLDPRERTELAALFGAARNSPFLTKDCLTRRATRLELQFELLACPHHSPYLEVQPVADVLCGLHTEAIRGFTYALNEAVQIDFQSQTTTRQPRCRQTWVLPA